MATWSEEVKYCLQDHKDYTDEESMMGARVKYRPQKSFKNTTGDPNIDMDILRHASNRLESLQYNIPLYISGSTSVPIVEMRDVSFIDYYTCFISFPKL